MANLAGGKRINMRYEGIDGNAFNIMGVFQRQARREKWPEKEISAVLAEGMKGDYNHLLATVLEHSVDPDFEDDEGIEDCGGDCDGCCSCD